MLVGSVLSGQIIPKAREILEEKFNARIDLLRAQMKDLQVERSMVGTASWFDMELDRLNSEIAENESKLKSLSISRCENDSVCTIL